MAGRIGLIALAVCAGVAVGSWTVANPSEPQATRGSEPSPPFQPSVPFASQNYGGGWGGYYSSGGGTVQGSALQGMASVVNAAGNYNLSTSAAAVNMTQAQKQGIINYNDYVNTYFETRRINKEARAAEASPRLSRAQLNRIAQEGAPKPLSARQLDPVSGALIWPSLLQDNKFAEQRALLEKAFAWRASYGTLNAVQLEKVRENTDSALEQLKAMIRDVDTNDYLRARQFLTSLAYEARKPVG